MTVLNGTNYCPNSATFPTGPGQLRRRPNSATSGPNYQLSNQNTCIRALFNYISVSCFKFTYQHFINISLNNANT